MKSFFDHKGKDDRKYSSELIPIIESELLKIKKTL